MDKVVHFEIPAEDMERAEKFYKHCFDWNHVSMPEMQYHIFRTGPTDDKGMPLEKGFISGGMMKRSAEVKHPVITIDVKDIHEALNKIKENGGEVVKEPMQVGDMGMAAYFKDSEGNVIGLWQNLKKD